MSAHIDHRDSTNGSVIEDTQELEDEELLALGQNHNHEDASIDEALAALEDIVFSAECSEFQDSFFDRHCHRFDDNDENQLCYTEIFTDYGKLLDEYLSDRMKEKLPAFNLSTFASWLINHEDEIAGDIVELVHSTTDFLHFKSLMLEHKKRKQEKSEENKNEDMDEDVKMENGDEIDLSQSFSVRSCKIHFQ